MTNRDKIRSSAVVTDNHIKKCANKYHSLIFNMSVTNTHSEISNYLKKKTVNVTKI